MIRNKNLYEFIKIFFIVVFCFILSVLFYVYMGLPRDTSLTDHETIESQSAFEAVSKPKIVKLSGWFTVNDQDSSKQLKKEIILRNADSSYSYPVQYIDRPDVASVFKNDNFKRAGFACQINSMFIKKGKYKLYMKYVYNHKNFIADLKREIQIQ